MAMFLAFFGISWACETELVTILQRHKKQLESVVGAEVSNEDSEDLIKKKWFHGTDLNLTDPEAAKILAGSIAGYFNAFAYFSITDEETQLGYTKNSNLCTDNFQKLDAYRTENKTITDLQIYLRKLGITKEEIQHNQPQRAQMGWLDCFKLLWRIVRQP